MLLTCDWLSSLQVVPGLFLELLHLLLLLLCLLLLLLQALLQAAASPQTALQPAVTTSSALSRQQLQFGCSEVTTENKQQKEKKEGKQNERNMQKITCYDEFMQKY